MTFGKKPLFKKRHQSADMNLQITAMADIFTVLLVFLLKSFASGAVTVNPSNGVKLPIASAQEAHFEALKVEISKNAVTVEGAPVAVLEEYRFPSKDIAPDGSSKTLAGVLEKERKRQIVIASANPDVQVDPKVMVVADQHVPYQTIKQVLASAAVQGYTDFKMAVVSEQ